MNINRHNYEEYFLLYVDNELSDRERKAVEAFISEQADLAVELDMLKQSVIAPDTALTCNKEHLFKEGSDIALVNETNFEEYFLLYADNELGVEQRHAVESFIHEYPQYGKLFIAIDGARLTPEAIIFPGKQDLFRNESSERSSRFGWLTMAAAAIVLILVSILWLNQANHSKLVIPKQVAKAAAPAKEDNQHEKGLHDDQKDKTLAANPMPVKQADEDKQLPVAVTIMNNIKKNRLTAAQKTSGHKKQVPDMEVENKFIASTASIHPEETKGLEKHQVDARRLALNTRQELKAMEMTTSLQVVSHSAQPGMNTMETLSLNEQNENVFLTNIPVDKNPTLKSFFRKAGRIINKVSALKNGERPGIFVGHVEIAFQ